MLRVKKSHNLRGGGDISLSQCFLRAENLELLFLRSLVQQHLLIKKIRENI